MTSKNIRITGLNDVYKFLAEATKVEGDVTLLRGKYAVDAKSILGVFSLDLSNETIVQYPKTAIEFEEYIKQFEV